LPFLAYPSPRTMRGLGLAVLLLPF
jgi:hypothetical protein